MTGPWGAISFDFLQLFRIGNSKTRLLSNSSIIFMESGCIWTAIFLAFASSLLVDVYIRIFELYLAGLLSV
jgi:hypothetical protein